MKIENDESQRQRFVGSACRTTFERITAISIHAKLSAGWLIAGTYGLIEFSGVGEVVGKLVEENILSPTTVLRFTEDILEKFLRELFQFSCIRHHYPLKNSASVLRLFQMDCSS